MSRDNGCCDAKTFMRDSTYSGESQMCVAAGKQVGDVVGKELKQ